LGSNFKIDYNDILSSELSLCSRLSGVSMFPIMLYNFDLIIYTKDIRYNIEFQSNYDIKEIFDIFKEKNIPFNDKLDEFFYYHKVIHRLKKYNFLVNKKTAHSRNYYKSVQLYI